MARRLEKWGFRVHPVVFFTSAAAVIVFVVLGGAFTSGMKAALEVAQGFVVEKLGWIYIVAVVVFLLAAAWLIVSPYGKVKLGKDDDEPEFGFATWFAMLFSAGMGIGLLFYSVAEPVLHFHEPRHAEPETVEAAREAMHLTFYHWGFHAWGIYIVMGASLAYFAYRRDLPLSVRSALYPLLGTRIHGPVGDAVDILAVFGTLFGLATSLGLGAMQINEGLGQLGVVESSRSVQLLVIGVITAAAVVSVVTGLHRGIRRLSELNLVLAFLLMLFVLFAGPTEFLVASFLEGLGYYGAHVVQTTFEAGAFEPERQWQGDWTMFYWGWWISWSPFVGMFIARISRGRMIRELVLGVLLGPTLVTFLWLSVFGNTALHEELYGAGGIVPVVVDSVPRALYAMLETLPWAGVTATAATIVVVTYFVTSSDSASLVIDIITAGGDPEPPVAQRIFWASSEGAVAAILLVIGGLEALQTAVILMALPFTFVLFAMTWGLLRALRVDESWTVRPPPPAHRE